MKDPDTQGTELDELVAQERTGLSAPRMRQFVLEISEGPSAGTSWTSRGVRCAIGSHESNDLVLGDRKVSRFHCEVELRKDGAWVRDVGSLNGTIVDGVVVREARLRDSSTIRLGQSALRLTVARERVPVPVSATDRFGTLVGASVAMRSAFYALENAARVDSTLLIEGETGTGKDVAAEAVHLAGARQAGPFVVVDCGAIPADLLESELFGHERGAFSGATHERAGLFESADKGTIFLDEIGELPLELQPKLLRVLEQRTLQRVGSSKRQPVDVRVIAATNRDLRSQVNAGTFRPDLYFRLAVLAVRMPALREHPDDMPAIVASVLAGLDAGAQDRERLLAPPFLAQLQRGVWAGNVRELRNHIERALVTGIQLSEQATATSDADELSLPYAVARTKVLDRFEHAYISRILAENDGNVSQAARAARMDRVHLHRLLRKLGLRG